MATGRRRWNTVCYEAPAMHELPRTPFGPHASRARLPALAVTCGLAATLVLSGCGQGSPSGPSVTPTATGTGATTYTYATVQPILATDCVACHGPTQRQAGVDLSSFAGVSRVVTPGSDQSVLVLVTQPGGLMYGQLSGDRTTKAGVIYDWVVNSKAAQ